MAKPDCDDGWLPYAHELDAALAVADFTKGARIVLREVFAQIFGLAKAKSARLSPTRIAEVAGSSREHIARATKELTDARVLIRLDDGTFRFNKNYETWLRKGQQRLTRTELDYCSKAPSVAAGYARGNPPDASTEDRNSSGNASTEDRNDSGNKSTEDRNSSGNIGNISTEDRNDSYTVLLPESLRSESPPPAPPLVNGREFETRDLRKEIPPLPPEGEAGVIDPIPDPDNEPFTSTGTEMPDAPVAVENDPAEVTRVAAMAERLFPLLDFGQKVQELAGDVPMWIVEAALWEFKNSGKTRWKYFNGILDRMLAEPETVKRRPKAPRQVASAAGGPRKYATAPADWKPNFLKPKPDPEP